ncbi:hypothetical protein LINGRAHAP2_LOCUS45 [Linum grandiflorum]
MAAAKFFVFSLFLALVLSAAWVDASVDSDGDQPAAGKVAGSNDIELHQLTSKIQDLESQIDKKTWELKAKDEKLAEKEKAIKEKADSISTLQSEVSSLQKKRKLDSTEEVNKANAMTNELEKQLDKLKENYESQNAEKEALQAKASEADLMVDEVNSKLKDLQKISNEQKSKIEKTERALKVAEEEMMKAKLEASSKTKELLELVTISMEVFIYLTFQSLVNKHWNDHGQPKVELVYQKALEKKAVAAKWAKPHLEIVKTKWIPTVKDKLVVVTTRVEPHVRSLTAKTVDFYDTSRTAIEVHVIRVQEIVGPYFQEAKKFSKPYIDQIATVAEPHVNRIKVVVKPYTKKVARAYGNFLESATTYHHQVEATVQDTLERHELTKPLATKEFVWFVASAVLALPILVAFRVWSTVFWLYAIRKLRLNTGFFHLAAPRKQRDQVEELPILATRDGRVKGYTPTSEAVRLVMLSIACSCYSPLHIVLYRSADVSRLFRLQVLSGGGSCSSMRLFLRVT